jgi:hypothetical protein
MLVHGRGQTPDYMRAVADRIGLGSLHQVFPAAADSGCYPGRFMDPIETSEPWLGHALCALDVAVAGLSEAGFGPEQTVLIGFSQGAVCSPSTS